MTEELNDLNEDVCGYQVDFATGQGLAECFDRLASVSAVINCAAITNPAACEQAVEQCRAVNIPAKLLDAMDRYVRNRAMVGGWPPDAFMPAPLLRTQARIPLPTRRLPTCRLCLRRLAAAAAPRRPAALPYPPIHRPRVRGKPQLLQRE